MGNFESDEGQHFFSFLPRGQITNPRPHTFHTILLNFLFIERNESIINVIYFNDFINYKTFAVMLVQKGNFVVSWQKYYPTSQCKHLNCIVCKFATNKCTEVLFLLLVAYRTFSKQSKRTVKKGLLKKKKTYSKWYHKITWSLQDFQNQF